MPSVSPDRAAQAIAEFIRETCPQWAATEWHAAPKAASYTNIAADIGPGASPANVTCWRDDFAKWARENIPQALFGLESKIPCDAPKSYYALECPQGVTSAASVGPIRVIVDYMITYDDYMVRLDVLVGPAAGDSRLEPSIMDSIRLVARGA